MAIDKLPADLWVALAGAFGALAGRLALRDRDPMSVVVAMASGSLASYFLAPWLAHRLHLGEGGLSAAGFLCGLTFMHLAPAILQSARYVVAAWAHRLAGRRSRE